MRIDLGLLVLRIFAGGTMLLAHGLPKLMGYAEKAAAFADPLGVGSKFSLILAIFAEAVCAVLVMMGLATRLACIPLMTTMIVAGAVVHAADPWARKELAFVYAFVFLVLAITGAGRFSLDHMRAARK